MHGYGFLIVSLVILDLGVGFYLSGPALERLHKRLDERLKQQRRAAD